MIALIANRSLVDEVIVVGAPALVVKLEPRRRAFVVNRHRRLLGDWRGGIREEAVFTRVAVDACFFGVQAVGVALRAVAFGGRYAAASLFVMIALIANRSLVDEVIVVGAPALVVKLEPSRRRAFVVNRHRRLLGDWRGGIPFEADLTLVAIDACFFGVLAVGVALLAVAFRCAVSRKRARLQRKGEGSQNHELDLHCFEKKENEEWMFNWELREASNWT